MKLCGYHSRRLSLSALIGVFLLLTCLGSAFADIEITSSINDVYHRGDHELMGARTITVTADDFNGATPESPLFMDLEFLQGAVLCDTKVDLQSDDTAINQPLYLPLDFAFADPPGGYSINASPDTLAIVRWVAGENRIWIRVQSSSATWINTGTEIQAPSTDVPLAFTVGISARLSSARTTNANLPFATRNLEASEESFQDAESTLLCVDLTSSEIGISGPVSLLAVVNRVYGGGAETSNGVFDPQDERDVDVFGSFDMARGKGRACSVTTTSLPLESEEQNEMKISIGWNLNCVGDTDILDTILFDGSYVSLVVNGGNIGFPEDGAFFSGDEGSPTGEVAPVLASGFTVEENKLYREIKLIWRGDAVILDGTSVAIELTVVSPDGGGDFQLDYGLVLTNHDGAFDDPPFDGLHQLRRCEPSLFTADSGQIALGFPEQEVAVPHVTAPDGGFSTEIIVVNSGPAQRTVAFYGSLQDGTALESVSRSIGSGATQRFTVDALFGQEAVSHFRYVAGDNISVTAVYRANRDGAGPAHVSSKSRTASSWRLFAGDPKVTWDGIAVVNRGSETTDVTVIHYDASGIIIEERIIGRDLAPSAKTLAVLSSLFGFIEGGYFEVSADQPLSLLGLRGDLDSNFLWENPGIALE